ncbi:hypothetical protein CMI48_02980 [Candidatus Pacearchaeota archaeon]|nr:hypothetical protein [Candidatus Pacearchaeota archaeon]
MSDEMAYLCECPELERLRSRRNLLQRLVDRCERLKLNADLQEPREGDGGFLEYYQRSVIGLEKAKRFYDLEVDNCLKEGSLVAKNHSRDLLPYNAIRSVVSQNETVLIHCLTCDTQIDSF